MSRSTTNKHAAGGPTTRERRKVWLVQEFRADVDVRETFGVVGGSSVAVGVVEVPYGSGKPACRCYRCGCLLTVDTVTADRRKPGCEGGDYSESNIRPACGPCNSSTGGRLGAQRQRARAS